MDKRQQRRRGQCGTAGSATLEYALLMPLILFIVLMVCQLLLLLRDMAVLEAALWRSLNMAAGSWHRMSASCPVVTDTQAAATTSPRDMYWELKSVLGADQTKCDILEAATHQWLREELETGGGHKGTAIECLRVDELAVRVDTGRGLPFGVMHAEAVVPVGGFVGRWARRLSSGKGLSVTVDAEVLFAQPHAFAQDMDWALQLLADSPMGKAESPMTEKGKDFIATIHGVLSGSKQGG